MRKVKLAGAAIAILFAAVSFQSCKDDDDNNVRMENQRFVTEASSSNSFEIAAGNLAVSKGQSESVKEYGEHMVEDHTAVGAQMATLAAAKEWDLPSDLLDKHQTNLDRLNEVSGAEFDREFARIMVLSHQEAVNLFTEASGSNGVTDAELRAFASSKLPALRSHLEEAEDLREEVNPD